MKNLQKYPYRGVFGRAAKLLGITGANAAQVARNRYHRGRREVVTVVDKLIAKAERQQEQRLKELNELAEAV